MGKKKQQSTGWVVYRPISGYLGHDMRFWPGLRLAKVYDTESAARSVAARRFFGAEVYEVEIEDDDRQ